jgi:hypothetical protein
LQVAQSERLRCLVEVVSYNGNQLYKYAPIEDIKGFEAWKGLYAGGGLGMDYLGRRQFLEQFTDDELRGYFANYVSYLHDEQGAIVYTENETTLLTEALRNLPRLLKVEYTEESLKEQRIMLSSESLSSLNDIASRILALPEGRSIDTFHRFGTVLGVLSNLDLLSQLKEFSALNIASAVFCNAALFDMKLDFLKSVQQLNMTFTGDNYINEGDTEAAILIEFLGKFQSLTNLRLMVAPWTTSHEFPFEVPPSPLFPNSLYWKNIHALHIGGITLYPADLRNLLQRHSNTLRSLELSDITFTFLEEAPPQEEQAQWILMIEYLEENLSLESMKFEGRFVYADIEAWNTFGQGMHYQIGPRQDECLVSRIERFIEHRGPCPFTLKDLPTAPSTYFHPKEIWTWEVDSSWEFDTGLLRHSFPDSRLPP